MGYKLDKTQGTGSSYQLGVRLTDDLRKRLYKLAIQKSKKPSQVARDLIESGLINSLKSKSVSKQTTLKNNTAPKQKPLKDNMAPFKTFDQLINSLAFDKIVIFALNMMIDTQSSKKDLEALKSFKYYPNSNETKNIISFLQKEGKRLMNEIKDPAFKRKVMEYQIKKQIQKKLQTLKESH